MPNRSPQNLPPTWCPVNPLVLAPGILNDVHRCFTGVVSPSPKRRCTVDDRMVLSGVPHRNGHVSGADTRGVFPIERGAFQSSSDVSFSLIGPVRTNESCVAHDDCAPHNVPQTFVNGSEPHTSRYCGYKGLEAMPQPVRFSTCQRLAHRTSGGTE